MELNLFPSAVSLAQGTHLLKQHQALFSDQWSKQISGFADFSEGGAELNPPAQGLLLVDSASFYI